MKTTTIFGRNRKMSCRRLGKVLQTYLDGELDSETALLVSEHLDECRKCGLEADTYEVLLASLQTGLIDPESHEAIHRLADFGSRLASGNHPDISVSGGSLDDQF